MPNSHVVKVGEKRCSRCAQVIPLPAKVCSHCKHEFSEQEMLAEEKRNARLRKRGCVLGLIALIPFALIVHQCSRSPTPEERAAKAAGDLASSKSTSQMLARATAGAAVKERMKNPSSFDLVEADANEARTDDGRPCWLVAVTYRGTNSFGGIVTEHALVWVDVTGDTPLRVVDVK